jgi:hypothetical protein
VLRLGTRDLVRVGFDLDLSEMLCQGRNGEVG